jgi:hypothetical protein
LYNPYTSPTLPTEIAVLNLRYDPERRSNRKKKFRNKVLMFLMVKVLPLLEYWPLKIFNPLITKLVNWYMKKKFPTLPPTETKA